MKQLTTALAILLIAILLTAAFYWLETHGIPIIERY